MKMFYTAFAIVAMFLVSCGDSTQDKVQGGEDAINSSNSILEEADASMKEDADTPVVEEKMDTTKKDTTMQMEEMPAVEEEVSPEEDAQ